MGHRLMKSFVILNTVIFRIVLKLDNLLAEIF